MMFQPLCAGRARQGAQNAPGFRDTQLRNLIRARLGVGHGVDTQLIRVTGGPDVRDITVGKVNTDAVG